MKYKAYFADINNKQYTITITPKNAGGDDVELKLSNSSPCVITNKSDSLFAPVKSRSCSITFVTESILTTLYATHPHDVAVEVKTGNTVIFNGYVTPAAYSQGYTYDYEELTVEAVDAISTLKYYDYENQNEDGSASMLSFKDILTNLCRKAGVTGRLYFPPSYNNVNGEAADLYTPAVGVSESNFFDNDENHTAWKCNEVLEEICQYLGWSCVPYNNDIYFIDYRLINKGNYGSYYFEGDTPHTVSLINVFNIDKDTYAGSDNSISYDNIYNKIEVSCNTYEVEDVLKTAEGTADDVLQMPLNANQVIETQWEQHKTKGWWLWKHTTTENEYTEYRTIYKLKDEKHWKHHFYRHDGNMNEFAPYTGFELVPSYNLESMSKYNVDPVNKYCNSLGVLYQKYAAKETNYNPTSLDWNWFMTFFAMDDTSSFNVNDILHISDKPLLEYTNDENIIYSPVNGESYIVFKGDIWHQFNKKLKDKNENLNIINTGNTGFGPTLPGGGYYYATSPIESVTDVEPFSMFGYDALFSMLGYEFHTKRTSDMPDFGKGWRGLKCKLQIGDKYWNGTQWVTSETTFDINYSNNPSTGSDEEHFYALEWMSPVNNTDYTQKVGTNGWCIPIRPEDHLAGVMKFTLYCPYVVSPDFVDAIRAIIGNREWILSSNFDDCSPVIFMKDFDLDYVYIDKTPWWITNNNTKKDILYFNTNVDSISESLKLTLRINSWVDDKPISRSYAYSNGRYLQTMNHASNSPEPINYPQEVNLIEMYYEHYNEPKRIYECDINEYVKPYAKVTADAIDGIYMVDSQSWDLLNNKNKIKIIEY